jgi:hypothetical protein
MHDSVSETVALQSAAGSAPVQSNGWMSNGVLGGSTMHALNAAWHPSGESSMSPTR